jgi:hypothetical protein
LIRFSIYRTYNQGWIWLLRSRHMLEISRKSPGNDQRLLKENYDNKMGKVGCGLGSAGSGWGPLEGDFFPR